MIQAKPIEIEKFPEADLTGLREELLHAGLDSWQAADLILIYLAGKGYGVSNHAARRTATRLESAGYNVQRMKEELEQIALVM
ncbi:hypothetical protein [Edaphobacter bradus]|uniref:hypothetical protein n=1 Tax=Edaphobacter bradus TaxID=2259016 RepID=UPI0021DFEE28|nr:hypothetical protein [Edaphobacter bradus]